MSSPVLRKAVENEFKRIIESLLYQSSEDECFEDYLLDLKYYGSVKTFKEICECNGQNYREVIQELKQENNND
jgi:hypothetical protein